MADIATPRPAATVVVLRPAETHPFDVLLVRRNESVVFMAGAHVFPGGRVDAADQPPSGSGAELDRPSRFADLAPIDEARHRVAALRELVEEAGVLLARRDGQLVDQATAVVIRAALAPTEPFLSTLSRHGLVVALDRVVPFAHWVTPEVEGRRFDARFFLARMPAGQDATHDQGEMTDLVWLAPDAAVKQARRGAIQLPPPTWCTLARLARFGSIDDAWRWAETTSIMTICPRAVDGSVPALFALPGHPTYPPLEGCEPCEETQFVIDGRGWRPAPR